MRTFLGYTTGAALFFVPILALAASASIGAAFPSNGYAGTGTRVSFSVIATGFNNPAYRLVDSFPGGATTGNMDLQGNFVWTPNANDIGSHTMTVLVSDINNNTATALYTVTVVNPTVSVVGVSGIIVQYGSPVSFSLSSIGFITPSYAVDDAFFNSSIASYNLNDTSFYWTPQLRDVGVHALRIGARDTSGRYATSTHIVTVQGLPAVGVIAPVAPGGSIGTGQTLVFTATSTNLTNPTYTVVDQFYNPASTTFKQSDAKISWTPVYNDVGVHSFSIMASESGGRSASGTFTVTVVPYSTASSTPDKPVTPAPAATTTTATAPSKPAPQAAVVSGYVFKTYMTLGSSGTAVSELQKKLMTLGFLKGTATGYFGGLTKKALQDFQKSKGLEPVGYTGPGTRAALNK